MFHKVLHNQPSLLVYGLRRFLDVSICQRCTCESCGNGAHYGYNCPPKVPTISNSEPCNNQTVDELPQTFPKFSSDMAISGDGKFIHLYPTPILSMILLMISYPKIDLLSRISPWNSALNVANSPGIVEADLDTKGDICFIENLMYDNSFPHPPETLKDDSKTVIDSNNDYSLSDDDSMRTRLCRCIPPPESDSIDILREKLLNVNLLIAKIDSLKDNPAPSSDVMTKSSSTSLNLFLEETNTFDNSSPEAETFCFDLEEISSGSTTTRSDYSLPDYEAFYSDDDHIKEKNSGSTTTHAEFSQYDSFIFDLSINPFPPADRSDFYHEEFADELAHIISPPEYDHFCFKIEPELGNLTMDVVNDIFPTREPRVHVPNVLPTHLTLDTDFILLSEPLFAYIVWIFLPFLTYPVAPPYLLSCGNEDTIFDPGISIYHSFMPDVSHRSGTFIKFNDFPDCEDSRARSIHKSFTSSASFWESSIQI
ncbi:hypothetical protein Tco_0388614 [Tanacetum coccineum]